MGQYNLNRIFKPRHVAVVGASEKAGTIGTALMKNLIDGGFSGMLLPVNPKYKTMSSNPVEVPPVQRPLPLTQAPWPEKMPYMMPPSSAPASCGWTLSKNSSTARS